MKCAFDEVLLLARPSFQVRCAFHCRWNLLSNALSTHMNTCRKRVGNRHYGEQSCIIFCTRWERMVKVGKWLNVEGYHHFIDGDTERTMNRPSSTSPEQFNRCRAIIAQCIQIESNEALTTDSADRLVNLDFISSRERSGRKCRFSNRDNECGVMVVNISNCTDARGVIVIPTTHHSWFVIKPKSYWKTIWNSQNGTGNEGIKYYNMI